MDQSEIGTDERSLQLYGSADDDDDDSDSSGDDGDGDDDNDDDDDDNDEGTDQNCVAGKRKDIPIGVLCCTTA